MQFGILNFVASSAITFQKFWFEQGHEKYLLLNQDVYEMLQCRDNLFFNQIRCAGR